MSDETRADRILRAIASKVRPYTCAHVAMAAKLPMHVTQKECRALIESGAITERWIGDRGPYLELNTHATE